VRVGQKIERFRRLAVEIDATAAHVLERLAYRDYYFLRGA
jgi:hypothetical protein